MKQRLTELRTPWGTADHVEDVGQGIKNVSTPSHGGYYVPSALVSKISPAGRAYAKKWSQSENWYEEDIGWAFVWVAFPELFKNAYKASENMAAAKDIVKRYSPGGERHEESVKPAKTQREVLQARVTRIVREEMTRLLTEDDTAAVAQKLGLHVDLDQLRQGMEVEREHLGTLKQLAGKTDAEVTALIAADHLKEYPDYYTRLKQVET